MPVWPTAHAKFTLSLDRVGMGGSMTPNARRGFALLYPSYWSHNHEFGRRLSLHAKVIQGLEAIDRPIQ